MGRILVLALAAVVLAVGLAAFVRIGGGGSSTPNGWPPNSVHGLTQSAEHRGYTPTEASCMANYVVNNVRYPINNWLSAKSVIPGLHATCGGS